MVVYIYTYETNPQKKDPWKDPWISLPGNDFHAVRGPHGKNGAWVYVSGDISKEQLASRFSLTPDPANPDSVWKEVPEERYCCRRKRKQ